MPSPAYARPLHPHMTPAVKIFESESQSPPPMISCDYLMDGITYTARYWACAKDVPVEFHTHAIPVDQGTGFMAFTRHD